MKRDDDFIRELLLEAEASNTPYLMAVLTIGPDEDQLKRHMHAKLLCDAGLFQEVNRGVFRLTNQGHDYLAAIQDEGIWKKTKEAGTAAGGVTLGLMKDIAVAFLKQKLAETTGLTF